MTQVVVTFIAGGAIFVVVGIGTLVSARRGRAAYRRFLASAVPANARVLELRTHRIYNSDGPDTTYLVPLVRFGLPDGRVVDAETMSGSRPAPAKVGDVVPVRYDPEDPTRVDLLGRGSASGGSCVSTAIGVVFVVIGSVGVLIGAGLTRLPS